MCMCACIFWGMYLDLMCIWLLQLSSSSVAPTCRCPEPEKNKKTNHTHINKECVDLQCVHVCVHVHEGEVVVIHLLTQHTHRGQT